MKHQLWVSEKLSLTSFGKSFTNQLCLFIGKLPRFNVTSQTCWEATSVFFWSKPWTASFCGKFLGYTPVMKYPMYIYIYMHILVGGLEHEFYFPYIGNSHPNWLSYFSEGLKPPTSYVYIINIYIYIYIYKRRFMAGTIICKWCETSSKPHCGRVAWKILLATLVDPWFLIPHCGWLNMLGARWYNMV